MQRPLQVHPLSREVERWRIAVECYGAFRMHLRRAVVERKVRRREGQHALREVAAGLDRQIPAVELGNPGVTGNVDAIRIRLEVQCDVAQRERRLLQERIQCECCSVDAAGDVPPLIRMREHRSRRSFLRLQQLCREFESVERAGGLAVDCEHDAIAQLQVPGRFSGHRKWPAGAQRNLAGRVERLAVELTALGAAFANAQRGRCDRRATDRAVCFDHEPIRVLVARVGELDAARIDAQEPRQEVRRPRARRRVILAQRDDGVAGGDG
jgi:hypothetical protein